MFNRLALAIRLTLAPSWVKLAAFLLIGSSPAQAAPILQQLSPNSANYVNGFDFDVIEYSAQGNVTAAVTGVNLSSPTSGCVVGDFAGFPSGNIALIARSPNICTFELKAENAAAAGASGVLIYNTEPGLFFGTLSAGYTGGIPVFGLSSSLGTTFQSLLTAGLTVSIFNDEPIPGSVPEPATLLLVATGGVVAALRRRRGGCKA